MKPIKIILTFLFFYNLCFSQIKNGIIEYNVNIGDVEGYQKSKYVSNGFYKAQMNAKYLTFSLKFNTEVSTFDLNETLGLDENGIKHAKIFAGYMGKIYQNKNFNFSKSESEFGTYYIKKEKTKDWVLENETKLIDGYLCYKATNVQIVINTAGTFRHPVVAWYCPKIPLPYGPNGYGNLPGLILELQERNVLFGVKKIDFNPKEKIVLENLKKTKFLTEAEFEALIEQKMEELKNRKE